MAYCTPVQTFSYWGGDRKKVNLINNKLLHYNLFEFLTFLSESVILSGKGSSSRFRKLLPHSCQQAWLVQRGKQITWPTLYFGTTVCKLCKLNLKNLTAAWHPNEACGKAFKPHGTSIAAWTWIPETVVCEVMCSCLILLPATPIMFFYSCTLHSFYPR